MNASVERATANRSEAQSRRDSLAVKQRDLAKEISSLSLQATAGQSEGLETLPELAREKAAADQGLVAAERELQHSENALQQTLSKARRERFDEALDEGHKARAEFVELFGQACVALGRYYSLSEEATGLCNVLAHPQLGVWPEHRNLLAELTRSLEPLRLIPEGFEQWHGYGWNQSIVLVAVRPKQNRGEK